MMAQGIIFQQIELWQGWRYHHKETKSIGGICCSASSGEEYDGPSGGGEKGNSAGNGGEEVDV